MSCATRASAIRLAFALAIALTFASAAHAAQSHDWAVFASRFLTADGRIRDTGNGNISHSEGQGYAMLLAVANDDRQAFDLIWQWTHQTLERKDVHLFSWRFDPMAGRVTDVNDAADGDVLIAWALLDASRKWSEPSYARASSEIRADIAVHLVRDFAGYKVLMPALSGFDFDTTIVLNPSYIVAPAFQAFAEADPDGPWGTLLTDGLRILRKARFGAEALPPDWLSLNAHGRFAIARGFEPRFGYDAIRVPLYLVWAQSPSKVIAPFARHFAKLRDAGARPPAWIDLSGAGASPDEASAGMRAIAALTIGAPLPAFPAEGDYYSSALWLLSDIAVRTAHGAQAP